MFLRRYEKNKTTKFCIFFDDKVVRDSAIFLGLIRKSCSRRIARAISLLLMMIFATRTRLISDIDGLTKEIVNVVGTNLL